MLPNLYSNSLPSLLKPLLCQRNDTHTHTHHAGPCRVSCVPIARPSWRHPTVCAKGKMSEITRSTIQCVVLKRNSWIHDTLSDAAVGGGGSLCRDNRRRTKASAAWLMVSSPRPQAVTEQPAVRWRSWSTWQIELAKFFFFCIIKSHY